MGKLDLMKKGLLAQKREELEDHRVRIRRLVNDLRMHSFYEDYTRPEDLNAAAVHQAACELQAEVKRAKELREEIEGLEK